MDRFFYNRLSNMDTHLSAPAHDNILLMRMTWNGWSLILMWKASLPQFFTMYLLAQMRPASKASDDSCSHSSDTRWMQVGNSSTRALLRPKSKIRILGSGEKRKKNYISQANQQDPQKFHLKAKCANNLFDVLSNKICF